MKKNVWVVEFLNMVSFSWEPTNSIGLSRSEGRWELSAWKKCFPYHDFRLKQYERIGELI